MALNFQKLFYDLKAKAEEKRATSSVMLATAMYQLYLKHRPNLRKKVCLDVGLGSGWAIHSILTGGATSCDGLDISEMRVNQTDELLKGQNFKNYRLWLGDAEEMTQCESGAYDYVNYLDIIEHLPSYERGVSELRRVLKKGGQVYIKTPNNYTDKDLRLHHLQATLAAMFLPSKIEMPGGNDLMLVDDMKQLSEQEQQELREAAPQDFHEHIHQFYPDELVNVLKQSGFEIVSLSGTPLFNDILYYQEAHLQQVVKLYVKWITSPAYEMTLKALSEDMKAAGEHPEYWDLPVEYVFSDNLVVVARKV